MTPTPTPDTILSLPVGVVASWLVVSVIGLIEIALLLAWLWRRHAATASDPPDTPPDVLDVPWLAPLLDKFDQGALVVDVSDRPVAWNEAAAQALSLDDATPELPLSLLLLVSKTLMSETEETTEILDDQGHRLQVAVSPLGTASAIGALVMVHRPGEEAGSAASYRRLISAMAHELRTPLTAILGHVDILGSCHPEQDEALWHRSRDFIASEAERLARLVEDLLTLSRLDLTPLQRRPVNLRAVAEEAISVLFQAAGTRNVRLALESPPSLPRVPGDRDRLYQVFLNLLDNAIKYSHSGGEVNVCLSTGADGVRVEVRDNGVGIAPEELPHVFEPLYRGQNVHDVPGTGLGLTIVRTILEQHGTTIHAESVLRQGTAFHFCLPCAG